MKAVLFPAALRAPVTMVKEVGEQHGFTLDDAAAWRVLVAVTSFPRGTEAMCRESLRFFFGGGRDRVGEKLASLAKLEAE